MYHPFPSKYYSVLEHSAVALLLETSKYDRENYRSYLFLEPETVLQANDYSEIESFLKKFDAFQESGCYLAGFFSYEFGYHFEKFEPPLPLKKPLAWVGVFKKPFVFNHKTGSFDGPNPPHAENVRLKSSEHSLTRPQFNLKFAIYERAIARIKEYLLQGDSYQINFTGKFTFGFTGSPLSLYRNLRQKQPVGYGAFLQTGDFSLLSLSPELFFRIGADGKITTRPMKGTAHRGRTLQEDIIRAEWLANDAKSRAENLMIVDLLRNDLNRITQSGSVRVPQIFEVEKFATLFQMTSTVEGRLLPGIRPSRVLRALFPCGSVTGAPKIRSMKIIRELEKEPRGAYTGALGFWAPDGRAAFNVAIRTIRLENGRGVMGSGGGIVWDSEPAAEFRECLLKANFLTQMVQPFSLIETLLWDGKFTFLPEHLKRMADSAEYFDFPFDKEKILRALKQVEAGFPEGKRYRVRLLLTQNGQVAVQSAALGSPPGKHRKVALASIHTNSSDPFLFHKTTRRKLYDDYYQLAADQGFSEILFRNERDEITEGAISNVFIKVKGCYFTPPLECGLLNGIYREYLMKTLKDVREKVITVSDLLSADEILLCNSVRKSRKVELAVENGQPVLLEEKNSLP